MGAIGQVGSFATDKPLENNYVGSALNEVENQGFKYRAEQRLAEEKKKEEQDKADADLVEHLKTYKFDSTMSQSINDIGNNYASNAFNQYADLAKKLQQTHDPSERLKLKTEQSRIDQSFSQIAQIPSLLKAKAENIAKNIDKYNPADVNAVSEKMKQLENGKALVYLDKGIPMVNIYQTDPKDPNKVTGVLSQKQSLNEFINSIEPHMKSDHDNLLKNAVANTGVKLSEIQEGFTTTTNKAPLETVKNENAQSYAELIANTPHEAYNFGLTHNIDENDKPKIMEMAKKEFLNAIDNEHKINIDQSSLTSRINANRDAEKDKIEVGVAKFGVAKTDDFIHTYKTEGNHTSKSPVAIGGDTVWQNEVTLPEGKVTFKNLGGRNSDLNDGHITSITKDKNGRGFVVSGKALTEKGVKFKQGKLSADMSEGMDLNSYSRSDIYGNFTRVVPESEVSALILKTPIKTIGNLNRRLRKLNPDEVDNNTRTQATTQKVDEYGVPIK